MVDWTLVNLGVTLGLLFLTIIYRKRILAALGRLLLRGSIEFVQAWMWDEVVSEGEDGVKVKQRALSGPARAQLEAIAPVLLQATLKSIKLKAPMNLPLNPATGQLDFMAPVLMKIASGKKIGVEDFLPMIVEKAAPLLESFIGGLSGKKKEVEASRNPFLPKELG